MGESELDERDFWDRRAAAWETRADLINSFSDAYGGPALDTLRVVDGERVLDVGCGPGTTAIELAARVAPRGEVVGLDVSPAMVAAATRRAAAAGVSNVRFVLADAQTAALGSNFDAVYSRFGVMFFADPTAAFANLASALRAGGRLACAVWGPLSDNPWMFVPTMAAGPLLKAQLTIPGPDEPGPFSLADPERVTTVLGAAGFVDIAVARVAGSRMIPKATAEEDVQALLEIGPLADAYADADHATRGAAVDAVISAIEPFRDGEGCRLPGVALIVTARRA